MFKGPDKKVVLKVNMISVLRHIIKDYYGMEVIFLNFRGGRHPFFV